MTAWLGIDLGTQGARALLVSGDGDVLAQGAAALTSRRDGVRHEQDPAGWWRAAAEACRAAMATRPDGRVDGIAVCATSGTVTLLDRATGEPLGPGLMYDDARATEEAARVERIEPLGHRAALPRLLWLLHRCAPGAGAVLAHQADVVTRALVGGPVATDASHALKSGVDPASGRWPEALLRQLGVDARVLPDVALPGAVLGEVGAAAARETGVPAGTPVLAGMTDGCAGQLAAGALRAGAWNSVLGTTLVLKGATADPLDDPSGVVYSHRAPDGTWLPGGASSSGAGVLAQELPGRDLAALDRAADARGPVDAAVYPLVSPGERFPFVAPDARRIVVGDVPGELERFQAILQGVAVVERLCFDYLDLLGAPTGGPLTLTGGAARSRAWSQLRADMLARPVRLPRHREPAFGMAVLAASSRESLAAAAAAMVHVADELAPRPERTARLHRVYGRMVDELHDRGWLGERLAHHAWRRLA